MVGFKILDDHNKVLSEIWIDPAASRANICNFWPNGTVMDAEDISLQEFIDVITAVRDRQRANIMAGRRDNASG